MASTPESLGSNEPLWHEQSILTQSSSIKLIAEIVSSNWQNDYSRKLENYETLGTSEYWIADYAGIGGTRHIGSPKRPTLSICTLENGRYQIQQFRGDELIVSPTFPSLTLTAEQILRTERSID